MWRWNALIVTAGLLTTLVTDGWGQDVSRNQSRSLAAKQKWVRFVVVRGRITALAAQGQSVATSAGALEEGCGERFNLHAQSGSTTVRYESRDAAKSVVVHFVGSQELTIERHTPVGDAVPRLVFRQHPTAGIVVTLGEGPKQRKYQAPTIWHLFLLQPDICHQELLPILEQLRPDWNLDERATKIETALLAQPLPLDRPPLETYVDRLADPSFRVRQTADRQLRQVGHSLLPFLDTLDLTRLNPEQKTRIAEIRAALEDHAEDSPQRVAAWLANDARVWTSWKKSEVVARRDAAAQHLAWLEGDAASASVELAEAPGAPRR